MSGTSKGGGFNIGSVGGSVSVTAGGDVVAGDKTTTTTTTITNGFKQEEDKQQFVLNLEELRSALPAPRWCSITQICRRWPGFTDTLSGVALWHGTWIT